MNKKTDANDRILKTINNKLSHLIEKEQPETWVTAKMIGELTGWTNMQLHRARIEKLVIYKKSETGGYRYLLESINPVFLKKTA